MVPKECPYCIVLCDDHSIFREGVKQVLKEKTDLEVVGEASDGLDLLNLLKLSKLAPNLVVLDISMPNLQGIEATSRIKTLYPDTKVLILSQHKEKEYLQQALSAGADGYALKSDAVSELFSAIERIRKGEIYISPLLSNGRILL
jgi:DNA-binding NarL/FixJ family response regulator